MALWASCPANPHDEASKIIKKQIIVKYIKIINPPWIKRISWGIKFEVFKKKKFRKLWIDRIIDTDIKTIKISNSLIE